MRLMKCCCCVSLQFGTMLFGCIFGLMDFYLGSLGIYYVTRDKMPHVFVKFFDKMDARYCVFWFSVIFYLMAFSDLLLITGAMTKNTSCLGPWLIVNFIVLICTIATALLSAIAVLRIGILMYAMLVVNSFYDELTS
ncbi:uncharacterized protein LOC26527790 [Drosophila mojavensis]|uniref:Uncharacterized protein n=1 Tax=Drosophila mojavensis TaxID=7230 RepID=A0A0Q9XAD3_DROMO|nr:uncharacterized protein LOC26527790 [Drosophila mojavensis]KRG05456.1 uncharacterized protein Dmoj_GI26149 [Drosophila mojavensis]